jgi:cytochrome c oxidase assembly protein subunit 15
VSAAATPPRNHLRTLQDATTIQSRTPRGAGLSQRLRSAIEFRYYAIFTVLITYGLIVLGGTVRVTDSGTACPDWPLCHGQVIPPADTKVWIEFSHRLVASIAGLIILGLVFWIWRRYWQNALLKRAAIFAVAVLALQVIVGGVTVGTETAAGIVAIHLTIALALLTTLIVIAVAAQDPAHVDIGKLRGIAGRMPRLTLSTLAGLFSLIVVGAFVSQMDAGLAYPDWPLFDGSVTSSGSEAGDIHYAHRVIAAVVGILFIFLTARILRTERNSLVLSATALAFALFTAQVIVGASNIWLDLATSVRIVHLALASALWAVLVFALTWSHACSQREAAGITS